MTVTKKQPVTVTINICLVVYYLLHMCVAVMFGANRNQETWWDLVYEQDPAIALIGAATIGGTLLVCGAILLRIFWNRLVVDLVAVRHITFGEAISIILVVAILFG